MRRIVRRGHGEPDGNFRQVVKPDPVRPEFEPERLLLLPLNGQGAGGTLIDIFKPLLEMRCRVGRRHLDAGIVADDDGVGDDIADGDFALADAGLGGNRGGVDGIRLNRQRGQQNPRQYRLPALHWG